MLPKHMRGFIDPITLGFIVALVGTVAALTLDGPAEESPLASNAPQAQATVEHATDRPKG